MPEGGGSVPQVEDIAAEPAAIHRELGERALGLLVGEADPEAVLVGRAVDDRGISDEPVDLVVRAEHLHAGLVAVRPLEAPGMAPDALAPAARPPGQELVEEAGIAARQ